MVIIYEILVFIYKKFHAYFVGKMRRHVRAQTRPCYFSGLLCYFLPVDTQILFFVKIDL